MTEQQKSRIDFDADIHYAAVMKIAEDMRRDGLLTADEAEKLSRAVIEKYKPIIAMLLSGEMPL